MVLVASVPRFLAGSDWLDLAVAVHLALLCLCGLLAGVCAAKLAALAWRSDSPSPPERFHSGGYGGCQECSTAMTFASRWADWSAVFHRHAHVGGGQRFTPAIGHGTGRRAWRLASPGALHHSPRGPGNMPVPRSPFSVAPMVELTRELGACL